MSSPDWFPDRLPERFPEPVAHVDGESLCPVHRRPRPGQRPMPPSGGRMVSCAASLSGACLPARDSRAVFPAGAPVSSRP
ncbi:hypothetical protein ASZ90_002337 [hydrocarbon metagenome]|uniref:Uncharacterized protein n=1 Tax=hydrocarbon metagenome TaxID=938273 RepID=A0A0W8G4B5_9ZZZZ